MSDLHPAAAPAGAALTNASCALAQSGIEAPADHGPTSPTDPEVLQRRWQLVLPHREQMLVVARRRVDTPADAEDVVTTALIRTVEHPRLDESRVGAFLCTTVMRLAVDVHRDRARQLAVGTRDATRALPCAPVEELLCDEAEARWLAEQLHELPARERQVLQARLSGLSAQQASAHLGLSPKATENAYTRVRQRAQGLLAATLAGLGILFGAGRRLARPELAVVPVALGSALVLAVVAGPSGPPESSSPETPVVMEADRPPVTQPSAPTAATAGGSQVTVTPATTDSTSALTREPRAAASGVAPPSRSPSQEPAPAPTRLQVTAPPVVDADVIDPGGVYLESRHTEESFEESVQRCLGNVDVINPLVDPCR